MKLTLTDQQRAELENLLVNYRGSSVELAAVLNKVAPIKVGTNVSTNVYTEVFQTDIICCARCGTDHTQLSFQRLTRPSRHTHWAWCPVVDEPIMLRIVKTKSKRKCPKRK